MIVHLDPKLPPPFTGKEEPCNHSCKPTTNNRDNPFNVYVKTKAFTVWCRMLHVFILLEFSIHLCLTCSPRYFCPPRVPISQLTLLLHCNKYYTTNTNNHVSHEGSVAGLGPVFIHFSAVRARAQSDWHLTLHCICVKHAAMFYGKEAKVPLSTVEGNKNRGRPRSSRSSRC